MYSISSTGLTVGSLFSGIGGLDLGFERAGFTVRWMCERKQYARAVLNQRWPNIPIYDDVRSITTDNAVPVNIITGGFPCQDISYSGKGKGLAGERSGLWWEQWRIVRDFRPDYMVAENVEALTKRGLDAVLGGLAQIGYDAEWETLPASAFGAPHLRERLILVAYPDSKSLEGGYVFGSGFEESWRETRRWQFGGMDGAESWMQAIPELCRDDDGIPAGLDRTAGLKIRRARLHVLGNAVVPSVAEYVATLVRAHAIRCALHSEGRNN